MTEERRREKRQRTTGPLHYGLPDSKEGTGASSPKLSDAGVILNVSDEGLCFITTCPLKEGQALVIKCPGLMNKEEEVTVRWCRKAAVDLWRIGLKRTDGKDPRGTR